MPTEITVIPLPDAAARLGLAAEVLTRLISNDILKLTVIKMNRQIMLDQKEIERMAKRLALRDKLWARVAKFEGETVGTSDAKTIYRIPQRTLYLCIEKGYIRTAGGTVKGGRGKKRLLNKSDVAYVSQLASHSDRPHHLFTPDTIPPHCLNGNEH